MTRMEPNPFGPDTGMIICNDDTTGLVMGRADSPPLSALWRVQSMQHIHNDIAFCLKLTQKRRIESQRDSIIYTVEYI